MCAGTKLIAPFKKYVVRVSQASNIGSVKCILCNGTGLLSEEKYVAFVLRFGHVLILKTKNILQFNFNMRHASAMQNKVTCPLCFGNCSVRTPKENTKPVSISAGEFSPGDYYDGTNSHVCYWEEFVDCPLCDSSGEVEVELSSIFQLMHPDYTQHITAYTAILGKFWPTQSTIASLFEEWGRMCQK